MARSCTRIVLKWLEVAFVVSAIAISQAKTVELAKGMGSIFFSNGSLFMAIVITPLLMLSCALGQREGFIFGTAYGLFQGSILLATGSLAIKLNSELQEDSQFRLAVACLSILAGVVYIIDGFYTSNSRNCPDSK